MQLAASAMSGWTSQDTGGNLQDRVPTFFLSFCLNQHPGKKKKDRPCIVELQEKADKAAPCAQPARRYQQLRARSYSDVSKSRLEGKRVPSTRGARVLKDTDPPDLCFDSNPQGLVPSLGAGVDTCS